MKKIDFLYYPFLDPSIRQLVLRLHTMSEDERGSSWDDDSEFGRALAMVLAKCNKAVKQDDVRTVLFLVLTMLDARNEQHDDAETAKAIAMLDELSSVGHSSK